MAKLPDSVVIGPMRYAVREQDNPFDEGDKVDGLITFQTGEILLESRATDEYKRITLWHEIIHGLFETAGHNTLADNETVAQCLASGIVQVLRDNPALRD